MFLIQNYMLQCFCISLTLATSLIIIKLAAELAGIDIGWEDIIKFFKRFSPRYRAMEKLETAEKILEERYYIIDHKRRKNEKDLEDMQNIRNSIVLISEFREKNKGN